MDLFDRLLTTNHKKPDYTLNVTQTDGERKEITQLIVGRLMSMNILDNRGFEADELEVELSDDDGALSMPSRGAILEVAIGWHGEPLVNKGKFVVDELQYSGAPDKLMIRARSADLRGSLNSKQERSFDNIPLGKLIDQLAKENGLEPCCAKAFEQKVIPHIDQTNESAVNLLSRLAQEYDAIATVKNGKLLFMPAGKAQSLSGKPLPEVKIVRQVGDNYQFSLVEGDNYNAVRAYWHNLDTGQKGEIVIDENSKIERRTKLTKGRKKKDGSVSGQRMSKRKYNTLVQTEPVETDADKMKTLRETYNSEARALNAAKSAFDKLKRGVASFSIDLAVGNAELMPELPVSVKGFKPMIDSTKWIISKVTHNLTDSGFTTRVECELRVEGDNHSNA